MPEQFQIALQKSLQGIKPVNGIAYLLCCVVPYYWIPVASSDDTLGKIPYYRLGYAFDFTDVVDSVPQLIENEVIELVTRAKIEAIVFKSSFYQEIIRVSQELVIVRSAKEIFPQLSVDARKGMEPLVELSHKTWGDGSFAKNDVSEVRITPDLIATKAAALLSDKHRFPPYFLLTDYVLSLYLSNAPQEEHICSNPLGYSYWLHKNLAGSIPPWITEMAKRSENYTEDLLKPHNDVLKKIYLEAIDNTDDIAKLLTSRLSDDVILVSFTPSGSSSNAKIKFWARHNRNKDSKKIVSKYTAMGCDSPAEALGVLLSHVPDSDGNDFLVVTWATWVDEAGNLNAIHISCDTAQRLISKDTSTGQGWLELCHPKGHDVRPPRIKIKFRPITIANPDKIHTSIERVLEASYDQITRYNLRPIDAINAFWKRIETRKQPFYQEILFPDGNMHKLIEWKRFGLESIRAYIDTLMDDFRIISHLGYWQGFNVYDDINRMVYINIANGFKDDRIAKELIEFIFNRTTFSQNDKIEYIPCNNNGALLLRAFYVLKGDGWVLDHAKATNRTFEIQLTMQVDDKTRLLNFAQKAFEDVEVKPSGSGFRTSCTILRTIAKKFSVTVSLKGQPKITLHFELDGGVKPYEALYN